MFWERWLSRLGKDRKDLGKQRREGKAGPGRGSWGTGVWVIGRWGLPVERERGLPC